ncbi:MAG: hypothetical protein JNL48_07210 [Acidobacteria bacterium]|nr:hypothetical protein [Acidobacteriota bacterium]
MRRVVLGLLIVIALVPVAAQRPTGPPTFEPGDTEGLVTSPNPRVRHAWKRKVFWKSFSEPGRGTFRLIPAQTAAERARMTATLDALTALLKATPNGSSGEGFWVMDTRTLDYFDPFVLPDKTPLGKYPLTFDTGLFPFYHSDVETSGKWAMSVKGETESAYFFFNRLPESLDTPPLLTEARAGDRPPEPFYLRPRQTASWQGLPVYEGQSLVIAREGRDPWAPVPVARALKAAMGAFEKDRKTAEDRLAGYQQKLAEVMAPEWEAQKREMFEKQNGELRTSRPSNYAARQRSLENEITVLRQEAQANANPQKDAKGQWYWSAIDAHAEAVQRLAALSPEEAGSPACFVPAPSGQSGNGRYAMTGSIVSEASAPGCRQIVHTNWDYFDLTLPRTSPQILFVRDFGRCVKVAGDGLTSAPITRWDYPPQGCVQHAQMWREVDWTKIAALVTP